MRRSHTVAPILCTLVLLSCSETPTETVSATPGDPPTAAAMGNEPTPPPFRGMAIHTARVTDHGTLVDGTAISASRVGAIGEGRYLVEFGSSIAGCAAVAQNALFPGSNTSLNNITTQVLIGFGPGLEQNDNRVSVNHYHTFNPDFNRDSGFTLIVVCPT